MAIHRITTPAGRKKIVYEYVLDKNFVKNMSLFFMTVNLADLAVLRKANLDDLYLYLKKLREYLISLKENSIVLENGFESLCKIANVQATENRERKRKLIGKFKKLSSKIAFPVELSFEVSSGRRWAYTPKITFPPPHTGDIMRRGDNKDARANILLENFLHELIALIKSKYPEGFETGKNKLESIIKYCR